MASFFAELKRRKVFRVAVAYLVVGWVVVQVADVVFPTFEAPDWVLKVLTALMALGFPVAILLAWAYDLTPEGLKKTPDAEAPPAVPEKSIAVLPFVNMSSDPEQEYFADGISEELLNALAKISELKVAGRTSSFTFKGQNRDIGEIGDKLRVATVLEGSVRKSGTGLRITAQLISVKDGYHIWSESYDREMADIFAIQDEISRAIVDALKIHLVGGARSQPMVTAAANIDAYNLYLLGRHHFEARGVAALERAGAFFERAMEADSEYAPAYDGLVDTLLLLSDLAFGSVPLERAMAQSRPLLDKALALDPALPETHASLGFLRRLEGDYPAAEAALKRAIELSPNMARAHNWLYITYDAMGRVGEAFEALRLAFELDPMSPIVNANMSAELWCRGRRDEALAATERVIGAAPDSPLGYGRAGRIHWTAGRLAEAVALYRKAVAVAPGDRNMRREYGNLLLDLGDHQKAEQFLINWRHNVYLAQNRVDEALDAVREKLTAKPGDHATIIAAARVEAWAGNLDQARRLLEPLDQESKQGRRPLFERAVDVIWDPAIGATDLALARARAGEEKGAKDLLVRVRAFYQGLRADGLDFPGIGYQEARVLALEGRGEEALASLREAISKGWRFWYTGSDPALSTLRERPEFKAMITEIETLVATERAKLSAGDAIGS